MNHQTVFIALASIVVTICLFMTAAAQTKQKELADAVLIQNREIVDLKVHQAVIEYRLQQLTK
jgi:hypothetical protein